MKKTCLKATSIVVGGGVVVCVRDGGQNDARNRASLPLPGCVTQLVVLSLYRYL